MPTSWRRNHVEQQALTDQCAYTSLGYSASNVDVITYGCRFAVHTASIMKYRPLVVGIGVLYMHQSGCGATSPAGSPHRSARAPISPPGIWDFGHTLHESGCGATSPAGSPHRSARAPALPALNPERTRTSDTSDSTDQQLRRHGLRQSSTGS